MTISTGARGFQPSVPAGLVGWSCVAGSILLPVRSAMRQAALTGRPVVASLAQFAASETHLMSHDSDASGPGSPPPAPAIPPAERERVVESLTRHFASDRLSEADLERRLDRVYQARTAAELDALLADLPVLAPQDAAAPSSQAPSGERIAAVLSGQERSITGVAPRELEVRARLGYVELDLSRATFAPGLTWIDVRAFMGYVQIRFPAGVRVESDGRAFAGFFSIKGAGSDAPGPAARVVRVTGRATFGFAECYTGSTPAPDDHDALLP